MKNSIFAIGLSVQATEQSFQKELLAGIRFLRMIPISFFPLLDLTIGIGTSSSLQVETRKRL
jgi:hypothetical protein